LKQLKKLNLLIDRKILLLHIPILIVFNPEKIQFIYNNDDDNWEFNYLLAADGSTFGTIKAFNKRNMLYNQILEAQEEGGKKQ